MPQLQRQRGEQQLACIYSLEPASEESSSEDTFTNEPLQSIDLADDERATAARVIDKRNAYIMDSMLKDVIKLGTGRRALALKRTISPVKQEQPTTLQIPGLMVTEPELQQQFGSVLPITLQWVQTLMAPIFHYRSGSIS